MIKLKIQSLTKENIISLRERAQLSKNITLDYIFFIEIMTKIINLSNILEKLYKKGYPKIIVIMIELKSKIIQEESKVKEIKEENHFYYLVGKNKIERSYKELMEELKSKLSVLEKSLIKAYIEKQYVRYIYGPQFKLFYNFFTGKEQKIISFLKYITNDSYQNQLNNDDYTMPKEIKDIINENLKRCNNYLYQVIVMNNFSFEAFLFSVNSFSLKL